ECALGVLAVDQQRPGETQRDLGGAHEVLDVARQDGRVERVAADVLEGHAGALARELQARPRRVARVIVRAVARDPDTAVAAAGGAGGRHGSSLPHRPRVYGPLTAGRRAARTRRPWPGRRPHGARRRWRPRDRPTSSPAGRPRARAASPARSPTAPRGVTG